MRRAAVWEWYKTWLYEKTAICSNLCAKKSILTFHCLSWWIIARHLSNWGHYSHSTKLCRSWKPSLLVTQITELSTVCTASQFGLGPSCEILIDPVTKANAKHFGFTLSSDNLWAVNLRLYLKERVLQIDIREGEWESLPHQKKKRISLFVFMANWSFVGLLGVFTDPFLCVWWVWYWCGDGNIWRDYPEMQSMWEDCLLGWSAYCWQQSLSQGMLQMPPLQGHSQGKKKRKGVQTLN